MIKKILDYGYYQYERIAQNLPVFAYLYLRFHYPSVVREIKMAQLKKTDSILQIGCGAIPYTLIILHRLLRCPVTGIDNQPVAVHKAMRFLERIDLSDHISVMQGDGKTFDVSGYDFILISYGTPDAHAILTHVLTTSKKDARILFRKSTVVESASIEALLKNYHTIREKMLLTQESIVISKQQDALG